MKRGRPFEAGNKFGRGRPRGSRNKKTLALYQILDEYLPALMRKGIAMALQGDGSLLRMLLDRKLPKACGAPIKLQRLPSRTIEEISQSHQTVIREVTSGNLTPAQGLQLDSLLETSRKVIETEDVVKRIEALEQKPPETGESGKDVAEQLVARRQRLISESAAAPEGKQEEVE
jgi:hypothetical protein